MKGGKTSITIAKIRNDIITKTASNERNLGSLKVICIWLHKLQMMFDITKEQIIRRRKSLKIHKIAKLVNKTANLKANWRSNL